MYAIALRYVTYEDRAKDVLQNTYIKVFENISSLDYKNESSTKAWMKKICVNEALKYIKKNQSWKRNSTTTNKYIIGNNHQLYKDELFRTLLKLPEQQRIVFSLFVIEGYTHKEIAQRLEISESNSRTIVGRAKKNLANHITKAMANEIA